MLKRDKKNNLKLKNPNKKNLNKKSQRQKKKIKIPHLPLKKKSKP